MFQPVSYALEKTDNSRYFPLPLVDEDLIGLLVLIPGLVCFCFAWFSTDIPRSFSFPLPSLHNIFLPTHFPIFLF